VASSAVLHGHMGTHASDADPAKGICLSASTCIHCLTRIPLPACPAGARRERNNNKHKRLFTGGPGALEDGQKLFYKTAAEGVLLRQGVAVINPDGVSGIRCDCCNAVRGAAAAALLALVVKGFRCAQVIVWLGADLRMWTYGAVPSESSMSQS
jgi:hypothetical protein